MEKLKCLHCGGKTIYKSVTPSDSKGTLTCHTCGETEDARYGIGYYKNNELIRIIENYKKK